MSSSGFLLKVACLVQSDCIKNHSIKNHSRKYSLGLGMFILKDIA